MMCLFLDFFFWVGGGGGAGAEPKPGCIDMCTCTAYGS